MSLRLHERIEVVFEDIDLIVIEKASGVLSYPVENQHAESAIQLIRRYWKVRNSRDRNLYLLHRLDQDTSGLMIFAKTSLARKSLADQFQNHTVVRGYMAVTNGIPSKKKEELRTYLGRDVRGKRAVAHRGTLAVTRYEAIRTNAQHQRAMIQCYLHTGRTHQVRIHLAHLGAPVCGDSVYGSKDSGKRLALHANTLGFVHPRSNRPILLHSSFPPELKRLM